MIRNIASTSGRGQGRSQKPKEAPSRVLQLDGLRWGQVPVIGGFVEWLEAEFETQNLASSEQGTHLAPPRVMNRQFAPQ